MERRENTVRVWRKTVGILFYLKGTMRAMTHNLQRVLCTFGRTNWPKGHQTQIMGLLGKEQRKDVHKVAFLRRSEI